LQEEASFECNTTQANDAPLPSHHAVVDAGSPAGAARCIMAVGPSLIAGAGIFANCALESGRPRSSGFSLWSQVSASVQSSRQLSQRVAHSLPHRSPLTCATMKCYGLVDVSGSRHYELGCWCCVGDIPGRAAGVFKASKWTMLFLARLVSRLPLSEPQHLAVPNFAPLRNPSSASDVVW
jgi:hypothetical protein